VNRRARGRGGARIAEDGQGLVELSLVLPIFFLAVFGLFDVGRLVYTNASLSQAAREGARLAATEAAWVGLTGSACADDAADIDASAPGLFVCPPDGAAFHADVIEAVNRMTVALGPVTDVHVSCNAGTEADPAPTGDWTDAPGGGGNGCQDSAGAAVGAEGGLVSVRLEYTYQPFTPVISSLLGPVPLSGSATMVIH
jgi:hypothetical protein